MSDQRFPGGAPGASVPDRPRGVRPLVAAMPFTLIGQVAMAGMGDPDVVPLWYGESDVPTPALIAEAAVASLRAGETFYTFKRGIPELRGAIAAYLAGLYGRAIEVERVIVTSSAMSGIMMLFQALVEPGDNVVVVTPLWPNVVDTVTVLGGEIRAVPLVGSPDGSWRLDLARVMAACDPKTRVIFVNSPGNPTGWVMRSGEAADLLAFTRRRGIWLVADEVYARFVYDGSRAAPSLLEIAEPEDRVVAVNSFSKAWAMTGWRLGWMVAPREIQDVADKLVEFNTSCAPPFLQRAGIVALEQGEPVVASLLERCSRGRDIIIRGLNRFPRIHVAAPPGAFYAFCRIDGLTDSLAFAKENLARVKVGVAPGAAFGPAGEGHLRFCFACAPARLELALERLAPMLG
ncbi:MAG TPA: pyridoxal phosphate-dependent aminotransferase [Stellaceae bacterium]|nr:pyridoxal phosphate-dependent aminotransferase [Stellaceae bacterium]